MQREGQRASGLTDYHHPEERGVAVEVKCSVVGRSGGLMFSRRARVALAVVVIAAICYAVAELSQADLEKAIMERIRRSRH